ncbi:hypothetical protein [Xanthomonas graminis]|nr:hypothetical protein [Xanthomonas translucens]UKE73479.1 hypothetical protein KFS85_00415 [Xanthomonas translucens pv. phleipratensis]
MAVLVLPFMALAAAGLLLSIGVHVASLFGLHVPGGALVWSLHIGIFVVWIPAVLLAKRTNRGRPQRDYWKTVLSGRPPWMRYAGYGLAAYALANFLWFIATNQSQHHLKNVNDASVIRAFSGHWLVFYMPQPSRFSTRYTATRVCCCGSVVLTATTYLQAMFSVPRAVKNFRRCGPIDAKRRPLASW